MFWSLKVVSRSEYRLVLVPSIHGLPNILTGVWTIRIGSSRPIVARLRFGRKAYLSARYIVGDRPIYSSRKSSSMSNLSFFLKVAGNLDHTSHDWPIYPLMTSFHRYYGPYLGCLDLGGKALGGMNACLGTSMALGKIHFFFCPLDVRQLERGIVASVCVSVGRFTVAFRCR